MRTAVRSIGALVVFAAASVASAQDTKPAHVDPLEALKATMKEQDALVDEGKGDKAVAAARAGARDATPDNLYLLGRALGNAAVKRAYDQLRARVTANPPGPKDPPPQLQFDADATKLLDEARDCFERASEAGSLVYAPSHLGLGRIARIKGEYDASIDELKQALRIAPNFKDAAIELAQSYWAKELWSESEYALHAFLSERPNDSEARVLLGYRMMQRKRFAEAESEFRAVLSSETTNADARKLLAAVLEYQEKFKESAEHWELARSGDPKDDEPYVKLVHIYRRLNKKDEAVGVMQDLVRNMPGTEAARRAKALLKQLEEDPSSWAPPARELSQADDLVQRLESNDPAVVLKALQEMRGIKWPALPARVYQVLLKDHGKPATDDPKAIAAWQAAQPVRAAQRLAAVRLIGDHGDPRTLTILEIMLLHPSERESEAEVRKEVAWATSQLPTDAVVPVLFAALLDDDADVREHAVQGLAVRTGKWFRADLKTRTSAADWPAELLLYAKWWASSSASSAKREAMKAMAAIYEPVAHDSKMRIAAYALPAMDDPVEATWRAGYDFFRALTYHSFGAETGPVDADERKRIAAEARVWLDEQLKKAK